MKLIISLVITIFCFLLSSTSSFASYDPLSVPNNKIGVHILFPSEIEKARELINTNGGDWGYVVIPIQAGDKDIKKWQDFMDASRKHRIIPILRLATEGDYFNKASWRKPEDQDIVDFVNFLNSLNWPTKNRYVIIFNEVNRADEWEGEANPKEYAQILSYAVTLFKSKNPDFFIISSGMDNAAATGNGTFSQYDYFRLMNEAVPGIFNQIDGYSSHSYPNPAFSSLPTADTLMSINSFTHELNLIGTMTNKKLPIFITETGWDQHAVGEKKSAEYFKQALNGFWKNENIVAITPFLLRAGPGPFEKFSLLKNDDSKNEVFLTIQNYPKIKGKPLMSPVKKVLAAEIDSSKLPLKDFSDNKDDEEGEELKFFVKWLLLPL
jgi:hypothetical protein